MHYLIYQTHPRTPSKFLENLIVEGLVESWLIIEEAKTKKLYTSQNKILALVLFSWCNDVPVRKKNIQEPYYEIPVEHPETIAFVLDQWPLFDNLSDDHDVRPVVMKAETYKTTDDKDIWVSTIAVYNPPFWNHISCLYRTYREAVDQPIKVRQ